MNPRSLSLLVVLGFVLAGVRSVGAQDATPNTGTPTAGSAGRILAAGSSTLGPVVKAAAEAFAAEAPGVTVEVEVSLSGPGIKRFCANETDLATSGRPIKPEEADACAAAGVTYDEYEVAFDGVAVVVNPANTFVECLTLDQLGRLWMPDSTVRTWADLDPAWPADPIALHGTGTESGTYQFFTQQVVGKEGVSRQDYAVSESHPVTADGVAADPQGLGFLPFPRYVENRDRLKLVAVDGGSGCVAPSPETIRDGSYAPLSRKLYLYVKRVSLARAEVQQFLRFWFADAATYAEAAGLVASPVEVYETNRADLEAAIAGTAAPDGPATPVA
jgi:phosphate transport system substrate-binding protein